MMGISLALLYAVNSISLEAARLYWVSVFPDAESGIAPLAVQTIFSVISALALGRLMHRNVPEAVIAGAAALALAGLWMLPAATHGSPGLALAGFAALGLLGGASYMLLWTAGSDTASPEQAIRDFAPILFFGAFSIAALTLAHNQLAAANGADVPRLFRAWLVALAAVVLLVQIVAWRCVPSRPAIERPPLPDMDAQRHDPAAPSIGAVLLCGGALYAVMVLGKMIAQLHLIHLGAPEAEAAALLRLHRVAMFGGSIVPFMLAPLLRWRQIAAAGFALYLVTFGIALAFPADARMISAGVLLLGLGWSMAFLALLGAGTASFFRGDPLRYGLFAAIVFPLAGSTTLLHAPLYRTIGWLPANALLLAASAGLLALVAGAGTQPRGVVRWTS